MNRDELEMLLKEHKQEHLLYFYDKASQEEKNTLTAQIKQIDWKLVNLTLNKNQQRKSGVYAPLEGLSVKQIEADKNRYYDTGMKTIQEGKVFFIT